MFLNAKIGGALAEMLALNAEIEGMKADNADRAQHGYSMAYSGDQFFAVAEQLRDLSKKLKSMESPVQPKDEGA